MVFYEVVDGGWDAFVFCFGTLVGGFEEFCEGASLCRATGVTFNKVIVFVK